ncbi:MAG: hypothetical protein DRG59_05305 [Deltaproteobacteria bacterium]|nr:MAG: hypothetical protein DRG59_05305 [Deltaproteobacteria bacterium]
MGKTALKCSGLFLLGVAVILSYSVSFAGSFKADVTFSEANRSSVGKIYVKGSRYRIEHREDGQNVVILVNRDTGITRVLLPSKKVYLEMRNTDPRSLMNNPFESIRYTETRIKPKKTGTETINGYECDKYIFVDNGTKLITEWVSTSLGFPIKMINHSSNNSVEIKSIKEGALNSALFELPSGYSTMQTGRTPKSATSQKEPTQTQAVQKECTRPQNTQFQEFRVDGKGRETDVSSIEKTVNPDEKLVIRITADCPVRPESKGKVSLYQDEYKKVQEMQFTLKNGESKTWELPAEKQVKYTIFGVYGTGRIMVSMHQVKLEAKQKVALAKEMKQKSAKQESTPSLSKLRRSPSSFSTLLHNAERSYSNGDTASAVLDLRKAILSVWDSVPLKVVNAVLVKDTGTYTPKPDNVYKPGEPIYIHCEILGHKLKRVGNVYHVGLGADFVVMSEDGTELGGKENVLTIEKSTPLPNTEFYIDLRYTISGLAGGTYKIKTTIHDRNSSKSATLLTPIKIEE